MHIIWFDDIIRSILDVFVPSEPVLGKVTRPQCTYMYQGLWSWDRLFYYVVPDILASRTEAPMLIPFMFTEVRKTLDGLKANGPDLIPAEMLHEYY